MRLPSIHRTLVLLGSVITILAFNSWILYISFRNITHQDIWLRHTQEIITQLNLTLLDLRAAEINARGHAIDRKETFLRGVESNIANAQQRFKSVQSMTADNEVQTFYAAEAAAALDDRFIMIRRLVNEANRKDLVAMKKTIDENVFYSQRFFSLLQNMKDIELSLLQQRSYSSQTSKNIFLIALLLTSALNVLIALFAFRQVRRNQVQNAKQALEQKRQTDKNENIAFVASLVAGDIDIKIASGEILNFFSNHLGIIASKIYTFERSTLRELSSHATGEISDEAIRSGLAYDAMSKKEIWQIDDIPANYWKIKSGLGETTPLNLVFLPLIFQGNPIGLIEMASLRKISGDTLHLLQEISEVLAIGLNAAQSKLHLEELLLKTQLQAEELQTQQEELKANNEELEKQARALESQQHTLNLQNQEIEASRRDLEIKAEDLLRSSQYKSEFLAKMSHELRTPLNGLLILSTLLMENKENNLTNQQVDFAKTINAAGNDLLNLISDILDLSKIEARKLTLRPERFSLKDLFEQMHKTFQPQMNAKKLAFNFEISEAAAQTALNTDRQRVEQILRNFLSNALKFTEEGEIILKAESFPNDQRLHLSVKDSGIGIPTEKRNLIFEAFEQADGSVSRRYGGTGLGLTISSELAALLGGDITLDSQVGSGSTFTLRIPLELKVTNSPDVVPLTRSELLRPLPQAPSTDLAHSNELKKRAQKIVLEIPKEQKTILIVEDDERFLKSVAEVTRNAGFFPVQVADGEVALEVLNAHTPNAILLDIKLPGISGLGLLEMIKQTPQFRHIPVHMISALQYQHNALRMGALGYLSKPVTKEKIQSALTRIETLLAQKLKRVLLIEDDEVQSNAIKSLIAGNDVEIIQSHTGKKAIARLKDGFYDCIILDLTLPDTSGFDLLAEMNSLNVSLPPVVIYTGKDLTDQEEQYLRRYSESIIIKGARSPERLFDEVNLFLHRVESMLPQEKRDLLTHLRAQDHMFEGKKILIVDDDMRNVFALISALESKGIKTEVARNGLEALEMLEKTPQIDLVLMDIMMPKMDGYEAMRRIRKHLDHKIRVIPIVALTAKAMKEDHEKCMEAGASDYLPKPINLNNLISILKVWLSKESVLNL